jgi:anthranilate synthase component II
MLLIVDNYDSFTFNLYQLMGGLHPDVEVVRNDRIGVDAIDPAAVHGIVLSPGPGTPEDSGVCLDILRELEGRLPILGVCLGHQAICHARGARIVQGEVPVHGKPGAVHHDGRGILAGLPSPFDAGRYHSLVVDPATLPPELHVTARTTQGEVMAVEHVTHPTWGVQFHPESVLTPDGELLLRNFLARLDRHAS